ncbi:Hpt domain-containing protein [Parahaliea mediterranea]|uniref:Hpt domain-containing protein n=1 Tax=Parahaliea mediterranea TaxID=651086 RepID=A0A939DF83_9GAMM|nr:Hpt domain-containing protein [Parahaliea mediterranea]
MTTKTDIVSLKWVIGLMNKQAENAEQALVEYSKDASQKKPLLQCMWAVHQITSTLRALGIKKGEMLSIEMERSLNFLYKDRVQGERRKLTMGGLMQALKVLPAYLAHVQTARVDTGQGLEPYVNDLRRWVGERPRPQAFFFHMDIPGDLGITAGASPAPDDEIKSRANVMLALYLEMAKSALRKRNTGESMKTVARIARKMQSLFAGSKPERFWFAQVGLCEGIAGGLIVPDECIAQVFKTGAFMIKYARENGGQLDPAVDYDSYLQQMLYYIASCKAKPVHIAKIREVFGIDDNTLEESQRGLIHIDALVTALSGALEQLNAVVDHINANDLSTIRQADEEAGAEVLDGVERAMYRLSAAGQEAHADSLQAVFDKLRNLYRGHYSSDTVKLEQAIADIVRGIVDVKLDVEYKLEHGVCSSFSSREFELRESVVTATFGQMALVENHLHAVLRRKALANALKRKPFGMDDTLKLTHALHRYLNKTDKGHAELRKAVFEADNGEADVDLLYDLAKQFLDQLDDTPERKAMSVSTQLLAEIAGALTFAGMEREGKVIEQCRKWLVAASRAGCVHEDEAFRCFADAFAQIELHLQRTIIDPLDDTAHMIAFAEQRAAELDRHIDDLSAGSAVVVAEAEAVAPAGAAEATAAPEGGYVEDRDIPPEFREVFLEESEEIVAELTRLMSAWELDPEVGHELKEIRRHFHTFKGNGRAVGANVLGELGWSAQDMLDRVLDGEIPPDDKLQALLKDVVTALPGLVASFQDPGGFDVSTTRELTNRCFRMAETGADDLASDMPQMDGAATPSGPSAPEHSALHS